jgi:hypothetical protein
MKNALLLVASLFFVAASSSAAERTYQTIDTSTSDPDTAMVDGHSQAFFFEPAEIVVAVRLQSGTADARPAYSDDWASHVKFVLTAEDGSEPRDPGVTLIRVDREEIKLHPSGHNYDHWVLAQFRLNALSKGRYKVTVTYDRLSETLGGLWVVHGDEAPGIVARRLQHQLDSAKTWDERKRILLALAEKNPHNVGTWFWLASGAEEFEEYDVTKAYYEKALAVTREVGGPDMQESVRGIEKTLQLLPLYYADRDHLIIVRESLGPGTPTRIELREREKPRPAGAQRR